MTERRRWALPVLLALPACLDPIVGRECAKGFLPCRGTCVVAGSCVTLDAAGETDFGHDASFETNTSETTVTTVVDDSGQTVVVHKTF